MKIAVLGATGMAGSAIVTEAFTRGHAVTAVSRTPGHTRIQQGLSVCAIDVADLTEVETVLTGVDAAVLAIRPAPGDEQLLAPLTRGVLDAAARADTRILVIGGSAPLRSPEDPTRLLIEHPGHVPEDWQPIARASLDQFRTCEAHAAAEWVYLSPPAVLEPGHHTGRYRRGTTTLLTDAHGNSRITAPDLAIAVIDELEQPGNTQHFTVASAAETTTSHRPDPRRSCDTG